ncbi:cation:proton antiporter [Actinocorallia sp. A-T 12471]|uniref:cation:proton antiporter n=1 Tax=Actinocorallia sp. A-T 12471 TaxID=3089813 RepID=UPI0029D3364B|nr:cation:proton antiporter [Actinocorallia sp. A-T 12471]MDX6744935.1 cation:proton antiporter [Actinocorallia sp. A-T 12471]
MDDGVAMFAVIVLFMLATVMAVALGERIRRPYPVLVSVLGLLLAFTPLPALHIPPELILPLFLPPLIYATAQRTSWGMLISRRRTIFWLAGVLVLLTVAATAATTYWAIGGVSVAAAVALGAAVAPPDPVAAEAVAGPLDLPRRLITVLQTEGLCNDATAFVVFGVAITAINTGHYSLPSAILLFVWEVVAAIGIGLGLGWVATRMQNRLDNVTARSALTLIFPFATYLLADASHASGVLAVLAVSLYIGQTGADEAGVSDRLTSTAFWDTLEMLITGLAFGLIGLELREVWPGTDRLGSYALHAGIVCAVVIGLRFAWMMSVGPFMRRFGTYGYREGYELDVASSWRDDFILAFCGFRGLATLALALALPATTPHRAELLFVAFTAILVTLIVPGLVMPWVVRVLGVQKEHDAEEQAVQDVAYRASRAALRRLRQLDAEEDLPTEVVQRLRYAQRQLVAELCDVVPEDLQDGFEQRKMHREIRRRVESQMLEASRAEVLLARTEPGVDPEAVDQVLRRLDLRSAHLL